MSVLQNKVISFVVFLLTRVGCTLPLPHLVPGLGLAATLPKSWPAQKIWMIHKSVQASSGPILWLSVSPSTDETLLHVYVQVCVQCMDVVKYSQLDTSLPLIQCQNNFPQLLCKSFSDSMGCFNYMQVTTMLRCRLKYWP